MSSCGDGEGTGDHMIIKFTKCQDAPLGAGRGQGHGESDGHNPGQNGNKHFEPVLVCCGFFLTVR